MYVILKRLIIFTFITIRLSIFIAIMVDIKQKVVISLIPKDERNHLNKELIGSGILLVKRMELLRSSIIKIVL